MTIEVRHAVARPDLGFGLVRVEGLSVGPAAPELAVALDAQIEARVAPLDAQSDARRKAARDILRNGSYKPTGRGKPASEYLLRTVQEGFPRINGPVDANNLVSLRYLVPISVWDLELAATRRFELRLGAEGESYVFNPAGQVLELRDLVCGCGLHDDGASRPLVTPIKDGMASKVWAETQRLAGVIYWPLTAGGEELLREATQELARWLGSCGVAVTTTMALLGPGETVEL